MKIKKLVIEISKGETLELTLEQAKKLYSELDTLFSQPTLTLPIYERPFTDNKPYRQPLDIWYSDNTGMITEVVDI